LRRFWLSASLSLVADQASKLLVLKFLSHPVTVLPGLLTFRYVDNPGAAFGFFAHQRPFLVLAGLALGIIVLSGYRKLEAASACWRLGAGLMLGGTLGNLCDRLRTGAVVDFIDLGFWPVFNLADAAIVCGAAVIVLGMLKERQP
jgi:signal peptidase II